MDGEGRPENYTSGSNLSMKQQLDDLSDEHVGDFTKIIFIFTAILSFLGNVFVLVLFLRNRKWLDKTYGRFIFALAFVDVLTAVCLFAMPLAVHEGRPRRTWPRDGLAREVYCRLIWSHYVLFSFGVTSVYTCFVLTVERWVAVVKPFYHRKYKASPRSLLALVVLPWLAGFLLEADIVYEARVENRDADGTFVCKWSDPEMNKSDVDETTAAAARAVSSFAGAIFLPALLIASMYAHILVKLQRETADSRRPNPRRAAAQARAQQPQLSTFYKLALRRATKMAACATIVVVICWLPCQTYSLLAQLGYAERETSLHRMLNLLAFFNSCLNPFIYAFSNKLYRETFIETFSKLINCQSTNTDLGDGGSAFV